MRVVHVIPSVARSAGGPSEVIRELLPALEQANVDIALVTTDKDLTEQDSDVVQRSNVVVARCLTKSWTFAPGLAIALWRQIGRTDIVHVHSLHTFPSTLAMLIARLRGRPVVLQPHGALNGYHLIRKRRAKLWYLRTVDLLGLRAVRTVVYSSGIESADGAQVLPNIAAMSLALGVDEGLLTIAREDVSPVRVLFLARLAKKKRLDLFIEALAQPTLSDLNLEGIVAGPIDPDLDYSPEGLKTDIGADRVTFVGQVGAEDRARLYATSAIYVLPSDDESFGMSVAEAMAAGCAVICSPYVGVAIDARDFEAAMVVEQDVNAIAESIRTLLVDEESRVELARRGRRYAAEHLTWSAIASQLIGKYADIASVTT